MCSGINQKMWKNVLYANYEFCLYGHIGTGSYTDPGGSKS